MIQLIHTCSPIITQYIVPVHVITNEKEWQTGFISQLSLFLFKELFFFERESYRETESAILWNTPKMISMASDDQAEAMTPNLLQVSHMSVGAQMFGPL